MSNIIDKMYDDLKAKGYLSKDLDTFNKFFFAPGETGYQNRKKLYDDLHSKGYLQSSSYEDFAQRIGLHSVRPSQTASRQQNVAQQANKNAAAHAAAAKSAPTQPEKGGWRPNAEQMAGYQRFTDGVLRTVKNGDDVMNRVNTRVARAKRPNQQKVNLGFNNKHSLLGGGSQVQHEGKKFDAAKGDFVDQYSTEAGNVYDNAYEADAEQYNINRNKRDAETLDMVADIERQIREQEELLEKTSKASRDVKAPDNLWDAIRYTMSHAEGPRLDQEDIDEEAIKANITNLQNRRSLLLHGTSIGQKVGKSIGDQLAEVNKMINANLDDYYKNHPDGGPKIHDLEYNEIWSIPSNPYLDVAKRSLEDAQEMFNEAGKSVGESGLTGFGKGVIRGFGSKLFDARTWDMGYTDLKGGLSLAEVLKRADEGKPLTVEQQKMLDAKATELACAAYFSGALGRGYKAGQVTAESIPFMLEFMLNPLSGTGRSAQAMLTRYALKRFGRKATMELGEDAAKKILYGDIRQLTKSVFDKGLSKGARSLAAKTLAGKASARIAGDITGAAGMTFTTGQGRILADALNRATGQAKFGVDTDGKVKYTGHDAPEESNLLKAYGKAFGSQFCENYSEFMGPYISYVGGMFANGLKKIGGKYLFDGLSSLRNRSAAAVMKLPFAPMVSDFIREATKSDWAKAIRGMQKRAHWDGTVEEYLEEVAGNMLNAILVGDNDFSTEEGRGVFNLSDNIDTFLGVGLMSGAMSVASAAGYRTPAYRARKMVENADSRGEKLLGSSLWGKFKSSFDAAQSEQDKQVILTSLLQNSSLTNEGRRAVLQYASGKQFQQAVADGTFREMEEDAEKGNEVERACRAEYAEGQNIDNVEEMRDAKTRYNVLLREALAVEPNAEMYSDPQWYEQSNPNATPEQKAAMRAYAEAKAQYEGVADRIKTDMADQQKKANEQVDRFKNQTDGLITRVRLRGSDAEFYVTSGHISLNNDGTINDAATSSNLTIVDGEGNQRFISRGDVVDVLAQNTPEETLEQLNDIIMNEAKAKADLIDGKLSFRAGDTFTILNNEGQEQKVTIAQDPSTMAMSAVIEGEQAAVPLTEDSMAKLQQMSDAYQESRFGKYRQEQQDAVANAENEATQEEATPASPTVAQEEAGAPTEGRSYGYGESVSYVDGEGHTQEGVVHGKTPDGTYEVEFENPPSGKNVVDAYTQEELDALVQPSSAEQTEEVVPEQVPEEEVAPSTETPTEATAEEEPAEPQQTALSRVPTNEETGEPMFEKADSETALDALNELTGGDGENTAAIVRAQVEQAGKALEALRKKKPAKKAPSLKGSPMAMVKAQQEAEANYNTAMEEYNAQVAAAEENLNAWSHINSLMNDRKRAIRVQQEAEARKRANGEQNQTGTEPSERGGGTEGNGENNRNDGERQNDLQKIIEIDGAERTEMEARIVDWLSEENLSRAAGKTRAEIFEEFGNKLEPIAYIPTRFISLVSPTLKDQRIYCGKGYFIDHALRNHGGVGTQISPEDVDVSKYLNIQSVLDNPDAIKETMSDGKRTVVFIKKIGRFFAELTQVEEDGKIVLHKSLFNQKKEPYAKLNDIRQEDTSSEGGTSSISHAENSAPAISLQSRGDAVSSEKNEHTEKSSISGDKGTTLPADRQSSDVSIGKDINNRSDLQGNGKESSHKGFTPDEKVIEENVQRSERALGIPSSVKREKTEVKVSDNGKVMVIKTDYSANGSKASVITLLAENDGQLDWAAQSFVDGKPTSELKYDYTLSHDDMMEMFDDNGAIRQDINPLKQIARNAGIDIDALLNGKEHGTKVSIEASREKTSENEGGKPLSAQIEDASAEVNTDPTEAQKEAGNYKKGHVQVGSFDITIEQPQGSVRKGTDANGKQWESKMNNTYGYFRGTEGVDGDHIDVFLSNDIDGWNRQTVFVVDQYNPDGSFDEHKVMLGFNNAEEAKRDYLANYEKGWENSRRIDVSAVNLADFEKWIASSHRKTKPFSEYSSVKKEGSASSETKQSKSTAEEKPFNAVIEMLRKKFPDASMEALTAADRLLREQALPGERQKAIEAVAKALGLKVEWRDTMEKENGTFNPKTRTITIARDSEHALANTFGHEVTHAVRNLSEADYKNLKDAVRRLYSSEKEYNEAVQAYGDMYTGLDFDALEEELIADNIGFMIGGRNDMTQELASRMNHRVLWAIHDAMNKVRNALAKVLHIDSKKNGLLEAIDSARATIRETMANAQRIAKENSRNVDEALQTPNSDIVDNTGTTTAVTDSTDRVKASRRTFGPWTDNFGREHKGTRQQLIDYMNENGFDAKDVDDFVATMDYYYNYLGKVADFQNPDGSFRFRAFHEWNLKQPQYKRIGEKIENVVSTAIQNGEYAVNQELSTDCIKREAFTKLVNLLVARGADLSDMGPVQINTIKNMMRKHGVQVACDLCFVEGKRLGIVNWAQKVVDDWNRALEAVGLNPDELEAFNFGEYARDANGNLIDDAMFVPTEELGEGAASSQWKAINEVFNILTQADSKHYEDLTKRNKQNWMNHLKTLPEFKSWRKDHPGEKWDDKFLKELGLSKGKLKELKATRDAFLTYGVKDPKQIWRNSTAYAEAYRKYEREFLETNPDGVFEPTYAQRTALEKIRNRNLKNVYAKMQRLIAEHPEMRKRMQLSDLLGSKGLMQIRQENGDAYAQLWSLILARFGTGTPKPIQDSVPYSGEVYGITNGLISKAYEQGGARMFSFSDFDITKVFDIMQIYWDMAARGMKLQSYSKEAAYVIMFGKTGAKINISTLPKAVVSQELQDRFNASKPNSAARNAVQHEGMEYAGLTRDADGRISGLSWSNEHSAKPEFCQQIFLDPERNGNCGAITVGASVNHSIYAAAQDWIRMVIPFHLSGMPANARARTDVNWYYDNTPYQNTRVPIKGKYVSIFGTAAKKSKVKYADFDFYENVDSPSWDMRSVVRDYVRWCEENNYMPRFDWGINSEHYREFCEKEGWTPDQQIIDIMDNDMTDGVWNGYYKFITDFTAYKPVLDENGQAMHDEKGRLIEEPSGHTAVTNNFKLSDAERVALFGDVTGDATSFAEHSVLQNRTDSINNADANMQQMAREVENYLATVHQEKNGQASVADVEAAEAAMEGREEERKFFQTNDAELLMQAEGAKEESDSTKQSIRTQDTAKREAPTKPSAGPREAERMEIKQSLRDGTFIQSGSYFSGGGLLEEGLKNYLDPKVAVEFNSKISGVYADNHGRHIVTADVRDVDPAKLVGQLDSPVEYFHASPVCKNFSRAKREAGEVELDKETARSTADFIKANHPKVVTIENVKGYRDSEALKIITDELSRQGYDWDMDVYNAADFGGYTSRERLIVRAVRDGVLPPKPKAIAKEDRKKGWMEAVSDLIPTLHEKRSGVPEWMDSRLKAEGIDWHNIDKPLYVFGQGNNRNSVPHAFADELLPTLRTKGGDVIIMPDGRVLRAEPRVLARVTGLSDDYHMPITDDLAHTIVGNGIPAQLSQGVIGPLLEGVFNGGERITDDDKGEVIPLSMRFNNRKSDVRYSLRSNGIKNLKGDNALVELEHIFAEEQVPYMPEPISDIDTFRLIFDQPIHSFLGEAIKVKDGVYKKIVRENRTKISGTLLSTLKESDFAIHDQDGSYIYVKRFKSDNSGYIYNIAVVNKHGDIEDYISSVHIKNKGNILNKIRNGAELLLPNKRDGDGSKARNNSAPTAKVVKTDGLSQQSNEKKQSRRGTPNLYPDHIAQAIYEQSVNGFKFDLDEAWHDSLLSVKRLQEAISETRGVPIRDFENVYWHAVTLSSVNAAEMEQLMNLRIQPFIEAVQDICKKHDLTQEDIEVYLNCKHGLERNEAMARKFAKTKAEEEFKAELKKAQKTATANPNDQDAADALDDVKQRMNDREEELYFENREKDYSGLTDIFDPKDKVTGDRLDLTVAELEDEAKKYVKRFEAEVGMAEVTKLWDNIHELNNYSLRKSYLSGLISKSQYDSVKQMYQWYVPLRGFNEEVAGDVYTYVTRGETRTQQLLKEAKGRTSRAGDILATMMNMANSAVNQGNRNLMKQKILNLALNAKSPLLSVNSTWYQTDANGFDVPIEPPINDQMTPSEQKDAIEQWEDTMEMLAKQGKVHRMSDNLRLNLRTQKWQADEHCIRVQRGGKEYCVWVNGNPRAAQALNDRLGNQVTKPYKATETILDKAEDLFTDGFIKIFRYMAQSVTSLNPEFVISNFQRDLASASLVSTGKYGVGYTKDFLVNVKRLGVLTGTMSHKKEFRNAAGIYTLYNKYKSRTLDNNNEMERYFAEFMQNGGETGYTQSLSIKDYQSRIQSALGDKGFVKWSKNAGHAVADFVEMANRGVENTCRFAAYMTSRQHGKSVLQSIVDAKEASTNFNLHGAGGFGNAWLRKSIIFINPAVQSIVQYCQLTAKHPKAMLSMLGGTIALGAAVAFACASMVAPGGGDPDSNYWDLSDYVRHNYIVIPSGNGNWTRIALPPEIRAVYGLGVIAMEAAMGRMNHSSIPAAIGDQLMQFSPVAFLDPRNFFNRSDSDHSVGKTLIKAFTPTLASPIADAYIWDEDFMGRQITGRNDFNEDKPEFQRVSYDTLPLLVSFSRWLNNISGGNDYKKGWINVNPSSAGYVASQYIGGPLQFVTKIGKTVAMITYEDLRDMRNVPFLSRFMTSTDNDYGRNQVSNAEFKYWSAIADDVRTQIRGFEKEIESGDTKNLDDYKRLVSSKEYEIYQMIDYMDWLKDIRELNQKRKEETTQDAQKQVTLEIYEVRRKMAECLNKAEEMGVYLDMSQLNLELANANTTEERAAIQAKINEKRKENLKKIGAIE